MGSFRELIVWKQAMDLCVEIYRLTNSFPNIERFGLTSQLRRAVVSIPSNIAEGEGRSTNGDFIRFLMVSRGSMQEVTTRVILAHRLGLIRDDDYRAIEEATEHVGRLLSGFIRSLRNSS